MLWWSVLSFLLMTGEDLPRKKVYRDWTSYIYSCSAAHWSALTDPKRKVKKASLDVNGDIDEVWNTDNYDNVATDLTAVQSLSYS